jgi:pimeloyl-ACP methyl ester carboxylesterase
VSATRLAYALDGPEDASVVVLSSSLGTTRDMWLPQVSALSREWRLLRIDHPGHGESPVWNETVTTERIGRAALDLLDELGHARVSWCGLSLGGAIGQWVAAHAPNRIERLKVIAGAAHLANVEHPGVVTEATSSHLSAGAERTVDV